MIDPIKEYNCVVNDRVYYIPGHMIEGINRYFIDRIKPGDFLTAVLENNFVYALGRADTRNFANIQAYAHFLYNKAPRGSWGSKKIVKEWLKGDKDNG